MERLTTRHYDGTGCTVAVGDRTCFCNATDRLAAYEDTGLEPEGVEYSKLALMGKVMAEVEEFDGIPIKRLQELAQAEKDGRLAILPCKIEDIVFDIQDGTPYETKVLSFSYFGDHWACRTVSSYPDLEEFGKRIFLTREEAEAALKMREEADNEAD